MSWKTLAILGAVVAGACGGCSSDGKTTPDSGVDDAAVKDQSGDTTGSDDQRAPEPDQAVVPPGLPCVELINCRNRCSDETCKTGCRTEGTDEATALLDAWRQCLEGAPAGPCTDECTDPSSAQCQGCSFMSCVTELDACMADTGPALDGFGEICDESSGPCKEGLECADIWGMAIGYCSKPCQALGDGCANVPAGTAAICIFVNEKLQKTQCGFVCKVDEQTYPCPGDLVCGKEPNPAGSTQYVCEPPGVS